MYLLWFFITGQRVFHSQALSRLSFLFWIVFVLPWFECSFAFWQLQIEYNLRQHSNCFCYKATLIPNTFSLSLSLLVSFSLWTPSIISLTALGYQVLSCPSMLIEIWRLPVSLFFGLFGCRNFRLFMHFLPGSLRSLYGWSWMFIWAIRVNILIQYIYQRFIWLLLPAAVIAYTPRAPSAIIFPISQLLLLFLRSSLWFRGWFFFSCLLFSACLSRFGHRSTY